MNQRQSQLHSNRTSPRLSRYVCYAGASFPHSHQPSASRRRRHLVPARPSSRARRVRASLEVLPSQHSCAVLKQLASGLNGGAECSACQAHRSGAACSASQAHRSVPLWQERKQADSALQLHNEISSAFCARKALLYRAPLYFAPRCGTFTCL